MSSQTDFIRTNRERTFEMEEKNTPTEELTEEKIENGKSARSKDVADQDGKSKRTLRCMERGPGGEVNHGATKSGACIA